MRVGICLAAVLALSAPAFAYEKIGGATSIERDVRGATGESSAKINVGDDVYADEVVTTAAESRAAFLFEDRTSLQMGPASRVKLDSFVYAGGRSSVFSAAKGAFRFVSSPSAHEPYEVKTPTATIAVRGTAFGVRALPGRTDAVIYSGEIEVCSIATGGCRTLDTPCTFVTVTSGGVTEPKKVGRRDWSFDNACKVPGPSGDNAPPAAPPAGPRCRPAPPPAFTRSGAYVGAYSGAVIGAAEFADLAPLQGAGFLGGLKIGYNWEVAPNVVAGLETDGEYRGAIGGSSNAFSSVSSSAAGYLGTLRGRLGYAFDRWLVYGTGGLAYGDIVAPQSFSGAGLIAAAPYSAWGNIQSRPFQAGYAAGGGVQMGIAGNLSVNAEYLYVQLAHDRPAYSTNVAIEPIGICNKSAMHAIRIGVNYGFSFPDLAGAAPAR